MADSTYQQFLKSKVRLASKAGFDLDEALINPALKPHNKLMVKWLVSGGRRACFAAFGLHKTVTQLEAVRCTLLFTGGRGLIICPLSVRAEFIKDAVRILGWSTPPKFIRRIEEAEDAGIYLTNYETVRDGKLDPRLFSVASLDEASVLRGFGGTKTFREFMRLFTGDAGPLGDRRGTECVPYRFVATATPSPNEYIELLAYADFLGIMDVSQAKTRFFKRDSTKADHLTLHKHKEEEFWLWVASWALFVQKPSDITGNPADDQGYELPPLDIRWHEIKSDHKSAGTEKSGQHRMFKNAAIGIQDSAKEKRDSLPGRIKKMMQLRRENPKAHRILWHDLEAERHAIEKAIPSSVSIYGAQDLEERENCIMEFSDGKIKEMAAKPVIAGSGCNFQRHCSWAIYLGIGFKFNDFIQSVHRLLRFLQQNQVRIDLIYTEAERDIRKQLERKWNLHNQLVQKMAEIIKQYGLSHAEMAHALTRKMGVDRVEIKGKNYSIVNNDCVQESKNLESNSIGLILTSIPFSTQYEYSPNYADFGHTENNNEFFQQMDFLTPELYRSLIPGRIAAIHVKDRIVPGGMTGLGFQTVYPFHKYCIDHYIKHGFGYLGMKTIVTDVVRENNQTYRLGWTEQCKDGSKMGVGMPEYLLLFRKPPSDNSNAYSDEPVIKSKANYTRSRWQIDAHGFARSNGDRLLNPEDLARMKHDQIYQAFKQWTLTNVYDFEHHVKLGEQLELLGKLPTSFMLLQPQSWSDEVWTDITRMLTLNGSQWSKGKEMHLCPMQFDIADRVIKQMSNEGDKVLDPFAGLMTVPYRSIMHNRYGIGFELNQTYFLDGASYCKSAELEISAPKLFDILPTESLQTK
jgi:DNA modification methylase